MSAPTSVRGAATYARHSRSWQSQAKLRCTISPFQHAISSASLHQRSFDTLRWICPRCARPVRRREARGSFHPFSAITRWIRFRLYPVANSRLTSARTRRAPYDARVRITARIYAVTTRSSAHAYRAGRPTLSRYAHARLMPSTRQIGAILCAVIAWTRRSSGVFFFPRLARLGDSRSPWPSSRARARAP
jgi:hypothetical protein